MHPCPNSTECHSDSTPNHVSENLPVCECAFRLLQSTSTVIKPRTTGPRWQSPHDSYGCCMRASPVPIVLVLPMLDPMFRNWPSYVIPDVKFFSFVRPIVGRCELSTKKSGSPVAPTSPRRERGFVPRNTPTQPTHAPTSNVASPNFSVRPEILGDSIVTPRFNIPRVLNDKTS